MKRLTVGLIMVILSFVFLSSPSILEARGGFGGHGGWGAHHLGFHHGPVGFRHGPVGFHNRVFFDFGVGFWPGPFYWGPSVVGWPYYPAAGTEASPVYSAPEQQQPYYWYYCQDPQGYYPYVKSCPGGWMTVVPNATPPNR